MQPVVIQLLGILLQLAAVMGKLGHLLVGLAGLAEGVQLLLLALEPQGRVIVADLTLPMMVN
jgi:hypothetical protein